MPAARPTCSSLHAPVRLPPLPSTPVLSSHRWLAASSTRSPSHLFKAYSFFRANKDHLLLEAPLALPALLSRAQLSGPHGCHYSAVTLVFELTLPAQNYEGSSGSLTLPRCPPWAWPPTLCGLRNPFAEARELGSRGSISSSTGRCCSAGICPPRCGMRASGWEAVCSIDLGEAPLALACWVTSGRLLNLSEPRFLHLFNGDKHI